MSHVKTAIFPVAGLGTRFLPITKSMPKEMLPLIDKPILQYAVDEAKEAGIERFVFVSSPEKAGLEHYFQEHTKLEETLRARGKTKQLQAVQEPVLGNRLKVVYQQEALGLGHAVWTARHLINNEPFAVILPDDVILGEKGCLAQMVEAHARTGGNMVATMDVGYDAISSYGCLDVIQSMGRTMRAKGLVEKPSAAKAPSSQAVVGRYILQPSVMDCAGQIGTGAGGEIQLTDAIAMDLQSSTLNGYMFDGQRYDCGSKIGYLQATLAVANAHPELMSEGLVKAA